MWKWDKIQLRYNNQDKMMRRRKYRDMIIEMLSVNLFENANCEMIEL